MRASEAPPLVPMRRGSCASGSEERDAMEIIAPIVAVKRLGGVHLRIECPFCKSRRGRGKPRFHFHGSGGYTGVYIGHRLSHCADYDLPEHLRSREISLGYH